MDVAVQSLAFTTRTFKHKQTTSSHRTQDEDLVRHRLISIAKLRYRWPLQSNDLDVGVYRALMRELDWDRLFLIVQSPDQHWYVGHYRGILAVYVPTPRTRILALLVFGIAAVRLSRRFSRRSGAVLQASDSLGSGLPAVVAKTMLHVPLLVQLQGDLFDIPAEAGWWRRLTVRLVTVFVCHQADRVRCVSHALAAKALRHGVRSDRIAYVPSRCDTQRFDRLAYIEAGRRLRREFGIGPDEKVVLYVGALTANKGIMFLISAISKIAGTAGPLRLLIVGSGPMAAAARERGDELGVSQLIRFCGQIPYSAVPTYMAASEAFVLPSLWEGLPRAILEAMAMQLPVVATAVGGIPELIVDGQTGYLARPRSEDDLAKALLLALTEANSGLRARAREVVVQNYGFDAGIRKYAQVLRSLTDSH